MADEKLLKKRRAIAAKLSNPKPVELPSGAWRCQKMINGERISVVDDDPEIAHAKINAMAAGLLAIERRGGDLTLGEAIDGYIERNKNIFSPATVAGYMRIKKNALTDMVGVQMRSLTPHMIQKKVNALSAIRSPKTVRNVYGLISAVYYNHYPDKKLDINLPQKKAKEISIPDEKEIAAIIKQAEGTRYELPILLAMLLGFRASEIRGLTWDCIDGDRIHINKAIVDTDDGPALKTTKTTGSDRWLKMPQRVKELIEAQPRTDEYIVHLSAKAMYHGFTKICAASGVRHYRFHDLRHVFASVSLALNIPMEYIRRDMGHKSDNMIKAVYGHMMEESRNQYFDAREDYFSKLGSPKSPEDIPG